MSKRHNAYQAYVLEENWTEKLQVITYAWHNLHGIVLEKRQDLLVSSTDILVLEIYVEKSKKSIYVVNIYNALAKCIREGEAIANVIKFNTLTQKSAL